MKTYQFLCGGDYGFWECYVDVDLTDEEASILKEEAKKDEVLSWRYSLDNIFCKIRDELVKQIGEDLDMDTVVIRIPHEIVRTALKEEGL